MKIKLAAIIFSLVLAGCQSSGQLEPISKIKPNVASEGSLANEKLISDATAGLQKILGESAITPETKILKFVIQQPVGNPGTRAWREMWVVSSKGADTKFLVTFKETGLGSADFEIKSLAVTSNTPESCPKTIADYKAGETTSQLVKSCLGLPLHENHNPDGRYVYLYRNDTATIIAFLFDTSGKLIRTQDYKQN